MPTRPPTLKRKSKGKRFAPARTEREFATNDPRWRRLRAVVLSEEPNCRECWQRWQLITPANEVDHIDGDPMNNDRANLQGLCKPCHSRKTLAEVQRAG